MNELIILTGANGHLGKTIAGMLREKGSDVRGLVLPGDDATALNEIGVEIVYGDVRNPADVEKLFAGTSGRSVSVIHAAAIIDITSDTPPMMHEVNVGGTKNIVEGAVAHRARRLIYISSVHAIPECKGNQLISETKTFSADAVSGGYAKTKAEAAAWVMDRVEKSGLPAIILHPSGIIGPGDNGQNHVVAIIKAYLEKRLPASIWAGYDMVDVRDVALAAINSLEKGRLGETYILSGYHCEMPRVLKTVSAITGDGPRHCPVVPKWMALIAAPFIEQSAKRKRQRPLVTQYAIKTLGSNDNFSNAKARRELGFQPRLLLHTLEDTIAWLGMRRQIGLIV